MGVNLGPFGRFKSQYKVVLSNFTKTEGEQPGPIELIPATKANPAVYLIHRNQFQHCKTTIAYLGCSTVLNISSRRLFLKTAAIKLENVQFDSTSEPYDEAIAAFEKHVNVKPKSRYKGNILVGHLCLSVSRLCVLLLSELFSCFLKCTS